LARLWQPVADSGTNPNRNEDAMSIQGLITTNDVLRHPVLLVSSFGLGTYLRCCKAIMLRRPTTFLACAWR
jgi:hypothetical protein